MRRWLLPACVPGLTIAVLLLTACTIEKTTVVVVYPTGTATPTAASVRGSPREVTPSPTGPSLPQGRVTRVIDGDTIEVVLDGQSYRVRYIGIDTPETVDPRRPVQCFGREASERNRQLVGGRAVSLEKDISETDDFGRLLRYVWADGRMVNAVLVEEGFASVATFPPDVRYTDLFLRLQSEAREAGRGLWGGCGTPAPSPAPGGLVCDYSATNEPVIKGNISLSTGERIYHVPGGDFYDETVIDEARGERWFCTEAEAVAAGWRKSKR